jgi:formylglycine-generating enzyme required for sulfatase activity
VDTPNSRSYEGPPHEVVITKPFEIGRYPVTQAQWEMVMGYNPSFFRCPRQPVENISWEEACQFICKLNRREAVNRYRLPTEAEWEYAASSGGRDKSDDDPHLMGCRAWFFANSDNKSQPVGMKIPNSWGLYDMQGNVWEWVYDWFGDYQFMCERDPTGPPEGSDRVIRGGGWGNSYWQCRLFTRSVKGPEFRSAVIGLRLVIDEDLASESLFSVFLGH